MAEEVMELNFVPYHQLRRDVLTLCQQLPADIVGVIGVPRSGSLVGAMVALHLHLPLSTPQSFSQSGAFDGGRRVRKRLEVPPTGRVLIIDDSALLGTSLWGAVEIVQQVIPRERIFTAAVYGSNRVREGRVDFILRTFQQRRIFEWNLFNTHLITRSLVDLDGVLCLDPVRDDDGEGYLKFIRTAIPHFRPAQVGGIVTCRLEKWRSETEAWLRKHNIEFGSLTMMQYPTAVARRKAGNYGKWKGTVFAGSEAPLFIESSVRQARNIHAVAKKPVVCTETMEIFGGVK